MPLTTTGTTGFQVPKKALRLQSEGRGKKKCEDLKILKRLLQPPLGPYKLPQSVYCRWQAFALIFPVCSNPSLPHKDHLSFGMAIFLTQKLSPCVPGLILNLDLC